MAHKKKSNKDGLIIVKKMRNYDKDPFFIKKAERAKAIIEKYGHPFQENTG